MYLLIFLAISVALAIPTFGVSLLFFFFVKNWFDNKAMSSLLGVAVTAMREEVSQERYHINRAAIHKVFTRFSDAPPAVKSLSNGGATLYWGVLRHPMINSNQSFSVRFGYIPRAGTRNTVFIKAAPGIDPDTLSAHDLEAILVSDPKKLTFNYPGLGCDDVFKELIIKSSRSDISSCECPNLQYGAFVDFVIKQEASIEYFANHKGINAWFGINDVAYYVGVLTLDASKKDLSGISISAHVVEIKDIDEYDFERELDSLDKDFGTPF